MVKWDAKPLGFCFPIWIDFLVSGELFFNFQLEYLGETISDFIWLKRRQTLFTQKFSCISYIHHFNFSTRFFKETLTLYGPFRTWPITSTVDLLLNHQEVGQLRCDEKRPRFLRPKGQLWSAPSFLFFLSWTLKRSKGFHHMNWNIG